MRERRTRTIISVITRSFTGLVLSLYILIDKYFSKALVASASIKNKRYKNIQKENKNVDLFINCGGFFE